MLRIPGLLIYQFYNNKALNINLIKFSSQSMSAKPLRNVEIKAKLHGKADWDEKIKIASNLTNTKGEILLQNDVFFKSNNGRLKLRYLLHKKSELIYYDRPDTEGPKLSEVIFGILLLV